MVLLSAEKVSAPRIVTETSGGPLENDHFLEPAILLSKLDRFLLQIVGASFETSDCLLKRHRSLFFLESETRYAECKNVSRVEQTIRRTKEKYSTEKGSSP